MNTPIKKFKDIIPTQQEVEQKELDDFVNMFYLRVKFLILYVTNFLMA